MQARRLGWWVGMFVVLSLLAGCARARPAEPVEEKSAPGAPVAGMPGMRVAQAPAESLEQQALPAAAGSMIAYTVTLRLRVENVRAAYEQILQTTQDLGGYVVRSQLRTQTQATGKRVYAGEVHVRVPAARLDEALDAFRNLAVEVLDEQIQSEEKTGEYIDLEARIRNLQATEAELRKFLERAKTTDEALRVYQRLTQVREEIERLEARKRYLEGITTYALIQMTLLPQEAPEPVVPKGWSANEVVRDALRALTSTLQFLATLFIWVVVYLVPVLAVVLLPPYLLYRIGYAWYRKRSPKPPSNTPEEAG